jgi:hypothetical protein
MFARLNSYNVKLNAAELRHAEFQGIFKWSVRQTAERWNILWDQFNVVPLSRRVRMENDSLMAEMFGIFLEGVMDGGQKNITGLYKRYDNDSKIDDIVEKVNVVLDFIVSQLAPALHGRVAASAHFLMLFAAMAHAIQGIPMGSMGEQMPQRDSNALTDIEVAIENINKLSEIITSDKIPHDDSGFAEFWRASTSSTQTIRSRRVRFPLYYKALQPFRF